MTGPVAEAEHDPKPGAEDAALADALEDAEAAIAARKIEEAGLALPLAGAALFGPAAALAAGAGLTLFGAPLIAIYIFGVWCALVLGAFLLSRKLATSARE